MTNGMVKPDGTGDRFSPNTPIAIICANTNEKIVVLCTIGQNFPPLSYFDIYTLIIWSKYWKISITS